MPHMIDTRTITVSEIVELLMTAGVRGVYESITVNTNGKMSKHVSIFIHEDGAQKLSDSVETILAGQPVNVEIIEPEEGYNTSTITITPIQ